MTIARITSATPAIGPATHSRSTAPAMRVDLFLAPGCPNAAAARALLAECVDRLGVVVEIRERLGDFPSPTVLVDGVDVMTDRPGAPSTEACRLDVPTETRLLAALRSRLSASVATGGA